LKLKSPQPRRAKPDETKDQIPSDQEPIGWNSPEDEQRCCWGDCRARGS